VEGQGREKKNRKGRERKGRKMKGREWDGEARDTILLMSDFIATPMLK